MVEPHPGNRGTSSHARKRQRFAIGASGVALALLGSALWVSQRDAQQALTDAPQAREPDRVQIIRPGHTDITMVRTDGGWRITEPCSLAVNEQRLSPLFEALNQPGTRYAFDDVDLDATGLSAPLATLLVDEETIEIGALDVSEQRRYLKTSQHIELAPEWILSLVDGGLSAFASPELFTAGVSDVLLDNESSNTTDWTDLQATQTVAWPLDGDALPAEHRTLNASVTLADGTEHQVGITLSESWIALVLDGESCARLLPPDALPSLVAIDTN